MKLVALSIGVLLLSCSPKAKTGNEVAARFHAEELPPNHSVDLAARKVFPYSVVPGGTLSQEEVKAKVELDPTVRKHYAGIDLNKLKPFRLTKPGSGYLSYRVGNRVFWTARRMLLKEGEVLLSDGSSVIRGRCGNRVSLVPMQPIREFSEPSERLLDIPGWDSPIFQAMFQEGSLPMKLPGTLPSPLPTLRQDLPDSLFITRPAASSLVDVLPAKPIVWRQPAPLRSWDDRPLR